MLEKRQKLIRIVTDGRVVPWHLEKTIVDHCQYFDVIVVGENVTAVTKTQQSFRYIHASLTPKINLYKDLVGLIQLIFIFLKERPAIVHSIMPKAGFLTALAAFFLVPVRIHTFTGQVWQTKQGPSKFLLKLLDKIVVKLNTICLTDSASQSKFLFDEGIVGRLGEPLPYLLKGSLGGVDLRKIDFSKKEKWSNKIKSQYSVPKANLIIGYLARKTEDKGAFLFLDLCKYFSGRFNDLSFFFVGPDDSNGVIEKYISNDDCLRKVLFNVGQVENHEEYLASFDILCLPSFREGFGSIVIDAAALEIPTVGSNIPGLVDAIVDMETGILFNAGDFNAFAESVHRLINNRELLINLGMKARQRVLACYDSVIVSNALLEVYRQYLPKN